MAGLAAAERLAAAGRRVVVLEARDRIGGRIHTLDDPGHAPPRRARRPSSSMAGPRAARPDRATAGLTLEAVPERAPGRVRTGERRALSGCSPYPGGAARAHAPRPTGRSSGVLPRVGAATAAASSRSVRALVQYLEGFHAADLDALGYALAGRERVSGGRGRRQTCTASARATARSSGVAGRAAATPRCVEIRARARSCERIALAARRGPGRDPGPADGAPAETVTARPGDRHAPAGRAPTRDGGRRRRPDRAVAARSGGDRLRRAPHGGRAPGRPWLRAPLVGAGRRGRAQLHPRPRRAVSGLVDRAAVRAPLLTGWVGGPRGRRARRPRRRRRSSRRALDSLASIFGRDVAELRARLAAAFHFHDWVADPFAGGAYSYGGVGAIEARAALARAGRGHPVPGRARPWPQAGRNATVHGALASGRMAAALLLGHLRPGLEQNRHEAERRCIT